MGVGLVARDRRPTHVTRGNTSTFIVMIPSSSSSSFATFYRDVSRRPLFRCPKCFWKNATNTISGRKEALRLSINRLFSRFLYIYIRNIRLIIVVQTDFVFTFFNCLRLISVVLLTFIFYVIFNFWFVFPHTHTLIQFISLCVWRKSGHDAEPGLWTRRNGPRCPTHGENG